LIATREVYNDNERELKVQVLSQENAIKALELERNRALINAQRLAMALGVTLLLVVTASLVFFVRRAQVLRVRANTDALTGALSRRAIEQRLEDAFAQPKGELSVLMFDLDHFKTINDRDGHAEGDRMLVRVVDAAQRNLREREVVGRLGGDEFLVVLPGADAKSALERAEAIRRALHAPAAADQKTPTISIGVATRAKHSDAHALVLAADRALLEAKQAGRDQIKVNEEPTR
jgi:diguanylate cyclase (GGDEF)-like protein